MRTLFFVIFMLCSGFWSPLFAQEISNAAKRLTPQNSADLTIQSGPMLGHVGLRTARIWLQLTGPGAVAITLQHPDGSSKTFSQKVKAADAFTTVFDFTQLMPGATYTYSISLNGKMAGAEMPFDFTTQKLWEYREEPPAFSFLVGSCVYVNEPAFDRPGKGYGSGYSIFETMAQRPAAAMIWLGDNTYFRPVDWESLSGMQHRYTHTRATPALQRFLNHCPHYAIWDDHDYGPNDSNGSFIGKTDAKTVFDQFWANPPRKPVHLEGNIGQFALNDAAFFLLDNRWFRTAIDSKTGKPQMLGKAQIDWLVEALQYSRASFNFVAVGGQMLSDHAIWENFAQYPAEQAYLLDKMAEAGIKNVFFLTGDRHHTEVSVREHKTIRYVDITSSALTSKTYDFAKEKNSFSVESTQVDVPNFVEISIEGPRKSRVLIAKCFDAAGQELWSKKFEQE